MFAVVLALAAAETRFFVPAGPLPAQQVAAPGQLLAPAEFGQAPAAYADYAPVYADYAPVYSAPTQGDAAAPSSGAILAGIAGFAAGFTAVLAMQGRAATKAQPRSAARMDETLIQKAFAGELEEEGAENLWQSELGWADYLDKKAGSSYAMNERPSKATDGYYTPDVFSNPVDIAKSWVESMKRVISDPLSAGFMTISNDKSGNRSYPKGATEVDARTIKPKIKNFDPKKRNTVPGFNVFGTPGTKIDLPGGFGTGKKGFFGFGED